MNVISVYKNYNCYFNRTLVRKDPAEEDLIYQDEINFNPNDGINAVQVVGKPEKAYNSSGNYVFITDGDTVSHWFILEARRIRGGQYRLTLRRDLLRDFYNNWVNSTCKINRAIASDYSPYVYNDENVALNQIKKGEVLLKDSSKMAWIVGFVDKKYAGGTINIKSNVVPDYTAETLDDWAYNKYVGDNKYVNNTFGYPDNSYSIFTALEIIQDTGTYISKAILPFYNCEFYLSAKTGEYGDYTINKGSRDKFIEFMSMNKQNINRIVHASISKETYGGTISSNEISTISNLEGKTLKVGQNYYKIELYVSTTHEEHQIDSGNMIDAVRSILDTFPEKKSGTANLKVLARIDHYTLSLKEIQSDDYTITMPAEEERFKNKNAPFDIFCIPYADDMAILCSRQQIPSSKSFAVSLAAEIGRELGSNCYDIQLLPFCPMTGYSVSGNLFDINSTDTKRYTFVENESNEAKYVLFWATASSGTFNITNLEIDESENLKIDNQCDFYRLVSPNYNGQFEFNRAKNGGKIEGFNVDYTYLPYSSYIHVNPFFGGLYGKDYDDARGLICQGDFSIMYLSDAWKNYQINNKNYNNIFDREIESLETQRKYERINQTAGIIGGAISAAASGASFGIVGGIVGGIASSAAGAGDLYISEKLYQEKLDYSKDMYAMRLDNIKAQPRSIAKTTAYTNNNKVFPVLEYYTCTEVEKTAFANMIANYSMTIGAISTPLEFIYNTWEYEGIADRGFISAELIEIEGIEGDDNIISEIAKELRLGVYTK